jgi:MFS family permease
MSGALVTSGFNALLAEKTDPENRTALFTAAEMAWVAAILVGSLSAALPALLQGHAGLSYRAAYQILFLGMVIVGVLATLAVVPLHESHSRETSRHSWLPQQSRGRILQLSLVLAALGLGVGLIVQLMPLWFHLRFHVGEAFLGPWYGLTQVIELVILSAAAPLARRWGSVRFVVATQALGSLALLAMGFAPTVGIAIVLWIARGTFVSSSWPVQQAYVMDVVQPADRATAASVVNAAWSVASALTPPIGGYFLAAGLFTWPFLLGGACYAASLGTFYGLFRHVRGTGTAQKIA